MADNITNHNNTNHFCGKPHTAKHHYCNGRHYDQPLQHTILENLHTALHRITITCGVVSYYSHLLMKLADFSVFMLLWHCLVTTTNEEV